MAILAWLCKVQQGLHKYAESIREAEQRKRDKQMERDSIPLKVNAVVAFDEKTVTDATAQNKQTNATQNSIKNATWAAFYAVSAYALITLAMYCAMRGQLEVMRGQLTEILEEKRPWVLISGHQLRPSNLFVPHISGDVFSEIRLADVADFPALNARVIADWRVTENPPDIVECHDPEHPLPSNWRGETVRSFPLSPKGGDSSINKTTTFSLSDADLISLSAKDDREGREVKDNTKTLWLVGCATYADGGGGQYRTNFCMRYAPYPEPLKHAPNIPEGYYDVVFRYCQTGNYTEHQENGKYVPD